MANDKVYIHEFIDIIGHNRANYMHHMTANWSPIAQRRAQPALLRRVGHGGHHPALARGREPLGGGRLRGPGHLVPPRVQPRRRCRTRRSPPGGRRPRSSAARGVDRVLVPAPWTDTIEELCAKGVRGETYAHEVIKVPAGTAWDVLELVRENAVPVHETFGWSLVGAWATAMCNDSEVAAAVGHPELGAVGRVRGGPAHRRRHPAAGAAELTARSRGSGTASCSSTPRSRRCAPGASRSRATATPSSCRTERTMADRVGTEQTGVELIAADRVRLVVAEALAALGVPGADAAAVAEVLVEADLTGVDSHGIHLLLDVRRPAAIGPDPPRHRDRGARRLGLHRVARRRARHGPGRRPAGRRPGGRAGPGPRRGHRVGARGHRTSGALGVYTRRVAEQGLVCLCVQNGPTVVPPYGGVTPMFSTNPFSYAIPTGRHPDDRLRHRHHRGRRQPPPAGQAPRRRHHPRGVGQRRAGPPHHRHRGRLGVEPPVVRRPQGLRPGLLRRGPGRRAGRQLVRPHRAHRLRRARPGPGGQGLHVRRHRPRALPRARRAAAPHRRAGRRRVLAPSRRPAPTASSCPACSRPSVASSVCATASRCRPTSSPRSTRWPPASAPPPSADPRHPAPPRPRLLPFWWRSADPTGSTGGVGAAGSGDDAVGPQCGDLLSGRGRARRRGSSRCPRPATAPAGRGGAACRPPAPGCRARGRCAPSASSSSTSICRRSRCSSAMTSAASLQGPAAMPAAASASAASSFVRPAIHASTAGRMTSSRWATHPLRVAKRSVGQPLGSSDQRGQPLELVLPADLHHHVAVARGEGGEDRPGGAVHGAERRERRHHVADGDHGVEHGDVEVLPLAGALAFGAAPRGCR